jgi:hypothetical protein
MPTHGPVPDLEAAADTSLDQCPTATDRQVERVERVLDHLLSHDLDRLGLVCPWSTRTRGRQSCRTWKCTPCALAKGQSFAHEIAGAVRSANGHGVRARHVTITDGASGNRPSTLADFNRRWGLLRRRLDRSGFAPDFYFAALGFNPQTGRLHRHVVTIGGPFIPHAVLAAHAHAVRLGHIVSIEEVRSAVGIANYVAANAVRYALAHAPTGARVQPISRSRR